MMRLAAHPGCRGSSLRALQPLISMTHGVLCFVKNSLGAKTQHRACASVSRSFPSTRLDQSRYQTALYNIIRFTDTSAPGHFRPKTLRHRCFGTGAEMSENTLAPVPKCLKTVREGAAANSRRIDSDVSMRTHVFRTVSSCFATLRQLRSICRSTSQAVILGYAACH